MPRVTQECDFTIHEDEPSVCSSEGEGEHSARGSLDGREEDDSYVEEPVADEDAGHADDADDSIANSRASDALEDEEASRLDGAPAADTSTHEETSRLANAEGGTAHGNADDRWEEDEGSYVNQDEPESNAETNEHDHQPGDAEHRTSYSHALDDSYADQHPEQQDATAPAETHRDATNGENAQPASKRGSSDSSNSHRRTSGRTDALIQAAAKAVVARLEKRKDTADDAADQEADFSILSHAADGDGHADHSRAASAAVSEDEGPGATPGQDDAGGDSSSHNGADDVFSDRSPRSSIGSAPSEAERKQTISETLTQASPSPRISNISQYEREEAFVPAARSTPRPPFRSPSSVKAMQMASPPPSVYGGSGPSSRRNYHANRLGSPMSSAQFSPRGRSTPSRLKAQKEAPLVLLHVTLLPLAWPWGDVLEAAEDLSEGARGLRDAWRQLQSRMGDTVLERGVLLPHPQNDYEVLEERVLESLELPLKRRARILECGHYLGPSNVMAVEDSDSEADDCEGWPPKEGKEARHWCGTCRHEIKYEALGERRVYRVKVYASNGLMKAGAWSACWKEMERVDVEIEPWVEGSLQEELTRLAAEQDSREEEMYMEQDMAYGDDVYMEREGGYEVKGQHPVKENVEGRESMTVDHGHILSSPAQSPTPARHSEGQGRSLLSPAQRMLASQGQDAQKSTTVISRSPTHVVPAASSREMQLEERSRSAASHRHHESRMLASPGAEGDERALPGSPQRPLLQSPPNTETQLERSHSSVAHPEGTPHCEAQRPSRSRMAIEDRSPPREIPSSPPVVEHPYTPGQRDPPHPDTDRRRRDEERLREIYGHTPPSHTAASSLPPDEDSYIPEASPRHEESYMPETSSRHEEPYRRETTSSRHEESYIPQTSPPSPSQQAFERREERRKAYRDASLPELLLEAARVFLSDQRNIAIMVLSVLVVGLAVRSGSENWGFTLPDLNRKESPSVDVSRAGTCTAGDVAAKAAGTPPEVSRDQRYASEAARVERYPSEAPPAQGESHSEDEPEPVRSTETLTEREIVRVVETVTETVKFTSTEVEVEIQTEAAMSQADVEAGAAGSLSAGSEAQIEAPGENQAQSEPAADVPTHEEL